MVPFATIKRPEVHLELECDTVDTVRTGISHVDRAEFLAASEPVPLRRMRLVRGHGGDDEVHQTAESLRGLSIRDIAENHLIVVRMSGVEVVEPAFLVHYLAGADLAQFGAGT